MKKVMKIVLLLILLFMILNVLTNCRYMYGKEKFTVHNLQYVANDLFPICYVGTYFWDGNATYAVVDILDVCEGHFVTSLGGHFSAPFMVILQHSQYVCSESTLPDNARIEQYHFVINMGENIHEAEYVEMDSYYCVGSNKFVQILVTVNCSAENPYFYSEDGMLYKRSDNSLVEGFFYYSDYYD